MTTFWLQFLVLIILALGLKKLQGENEKHIAARRGELRPAAHFIEKTEALFAEQEERMPACCQPSCC